MDLLKTALMALVIYIAAPLAVEYVKVNYLHSDAYEVPRMQKLIVDDPVLKDGSVLRR